MTSHTPGPWHQDEKGKYVYDSDGSCIADQRRAKVGGEFGPNGEWYEGGKFIATTARPKAAPRSGRKLTPEEIKARAEESARLLVIREKLASLAVQVTPIADRLSDGRGGFCDSLAAGLRRGVIPEGRAWTIMLDILAKQAGRRGSKAYNTSYDTLVAQLEPMVAKYLAIYSSP